MLFISSYLHTTTLILAQPSFLILLYNHLLSLISKSSCLKPAIRSTMFHVLLSALTPQLWFFKVSFSRHLQYNVSPSFFSHSPLLASLFLSLVSLQSLNKATKTLLNRKRALPTIKQTSSEIPINF